MFIWDFLPLVLLILCSYAAGNINIILPLVWQESSEIELFQHFLCSWKFSIPISFQFLYSGPKNISLICPQINHSLIVRGLSDEYSFYLSALSPDELRILCLEPNDIYGAGYFADMLENAQILFLDRRLMESPSYRFIISFNTIIFKPIHIMYYDNISSLHNVIENEVYKVYPIITKDRHQYSSHEYLNSIDGHAFNPFLFNSIIPPVFDIDTTNYILDITKSARREWLAGNLSEPYHHAIKIIRETWGKHCDGFLAVSNMTDTSISTLSVGPDKEGWKESYDDMWLKSQIIWKLIATTLLPYYDYFLLGGDDLYVIVNNLRSLLNSKRIKQLSENGMRPIYLGRELIRNKLFSFHSGGAGYVLNRAAVAVLYNLTLTIEPCLTTIHTSMEDVLVAYCLRHAGVYTTSTANDVDGRETFHPIRPGAASEANIEWYLRMANTSLPGESCCSRESISFHQVRPPEYMSCLHSKLMKDSLVD
eukprot:gene2856-5616_t